MGLQQTLSKPEPPARSQRANKGDWKDKADMPTKPGGLKRSGKGAGTLRERAARTRARGARVLWHAAHSKQV